MTTTTQALLAVDGLFIAPSLGAPGRVLCGSPQLAGTALSIVAPGSTGLAGTRLDRPSERRTAGSWVLKAGLVEHSQKSFAMAGAYIDANVWPLSPQGRSSG